MEPKPLPTTTPITHEDLTIRPRPESAERMGAEHPEGSSEIILSAEETQFPGCRHPPGRRDPRRGLAGCQDGLAPYGEEKP
jgi:hypothetical protein